MPARVFYLFIFIVGSSSLCADLYEELGVKREASLKEIESAYRGIVIRTHPDTHSGQLTDEEKKALTTKYKAASEAYEVLKDDEKRARYDRYGSVNTEPEVEPEPVRTRRRITVPEFLSKLDASDENREKKLLLYYSKFGNEIPLSELLQLGTALSDRSIADHWFKYYYEENRRSLSPKERLSLARSITYAIGFRDSLYEEYLQSSLPLAQWEKVKIISSIKNIEVRDRALRQIHKKDWPAGVNDQERLASLGSIGLQSDLLNTSLFGSCFRSLWRVSGLNR